MSRFKELSPATASRDLKKAVEKKWKKNTGIKKQLLTKKDDVPLIKIRKKITSV